MSYLQLMFTRSVKKHKKVESEVGLTPGNSGIRLNKRERVPAEPYVQLADFFGTREICSEKLRLNISGTIFEIRLVLLLRYPDLRLGKLALLHVKHREIEHSIPIKYFIFEETVEDLCDHFDPTLNEIYFERSPFQFESIVDFYRSKQVHVASGSCDELFFEEIQFWGLKEHNVSLCCLERFLRSSKSLKDCDEISTSDLVTTSEDHEAPRCNSKCFRAKIWHFLENPLSSVPAAVYSVISLLFVLVTVILLVLGSMPEYQIEVSTDNSTERIVDPKIDDADTVCLIFFTAEHLARIWAAPARWAYLKSPFCIIDFLAIVPFYFELLMQHIGFKNEFLGDVKRSFLVIRVLRALRIARVLRVLKVARYSHGFKSLGTTFQKCWKESCMLLVFMMSTNLILSTIVYNLEVENETPGFDSIPAASWWCIITMTTVGYGDVYPHTTLGKMFAGVVGMVGIILLAFPISLIVEHFHTEYRST